ncbi:glutamine synthetase-like [Hippoglossus stenolepis]|uniref:glutamine synthetase-like n=1 Tax=Hippoglossus stenolepis TaxID=195615 RepID=UPI001FAF4B46|nr:glutamine synthetase-like [Hippoglossus stenolepis]
MSLLPEILSRHKMVRKHYLSLQKGEECQVTYVWVNEDRQNLQSKTRTLYNEPAGIRDIPEWYATSADHTEVTLVPVRMFRDPFTLDPDKLVLCELVNSKHISKVNHRRSQCVTVMDEVKQFQPWFGMEQEYILFGLDGKQLGWSPEGNQLQRACSNAVGANKLCGRDISMCHCRACLYAGVKIFGSNAEDLWSQWEFQVGTCEGIEMGDHLWMARYILHRVCEDFEVVASLDVKPIKESLQSSGCHINFSTKEMRSEGGLQYIEEAIRNLSKRHSQHLIVYDAHGGLDNKGRLTGKGCTSSFHHFSTAVACRNVSVRIPGHVSRMGCGYLEDRRPAANCDPYLVMRTLVETCLLGATDEDDEEV